MQKIRMKRDKDITIRDACEEFVRRRKVKNYSPYTIKYYNTNIHIFGLFCDLDLPIPVINEDLINQLPFSFGSVRAHFSNGEFCLNYMSIVSKVLVL
jgi:hypothetical protein